MLWVGFMQPGGGGLAQKQTEAFDQKGSINAVAIECRAHSRVDSSRAERERERIRVREQRVHVLYETPALRVTIVVVLCIHA